MTRTMSTRQRWARWLSLAAAAGMLVVLLMGARVTDTGSAQGCGRDWPLCQGSFVPNLALTKTAIEFEHRVVTSLETLFVLGTVWVGLDLRRERPFLGILYALTVLFLLVQAGMGAWAVMVPQQATILALHFGISLIALAASALTALVIWRGDPGEVADLPAKARVGVWVLAAYLYALVYSGAYVRHTGASAACQSWPLCAGGTAAADASLVHRLGASVALVGAIGLWLYLRRVMPKRDDLHRPALVLLASLLVQGAAGAYLVLSGYTLVSELLHTALAATTFVAAAWLCLQVLPTRVASAGAVMAISRS